MTTASIYANPTALVSADRVYDHLGDPHVRPPAQLPRRLPMSATTANKALVRRYIEQIWNRGDLAALEQLVAEGYAGHDPACRGEPRGRADLRALIDTYRTAMPDVQVTVDQQVAEGDCVVTRWNACGTHLGRLWAIGPTGRQVAVSGLSLHRVCADKLTEEWTSFDALALVQHLWAVPTRASAHVAT